MALRLRNYRTEMRREDYIEPPASQIVRATETVDSLGARTIRFVYETPWNATKKSPYFSPSLNKRLKFYLKYDNFFSLCLLPCKTAKMTLKYELNFGGSSAVIKAPAAQINSLNQTMEFKLDCLSCASSDIRSLLIFDMSAIASGSQLIKCTIELIENATSGQHNVTNKVPERELLRDLRQLFENRDSCDVTFAIHDQEVPAHKLILSARSPVFAAMFKQEMKESRDNRVAVDDTEPEVFHEMLRFIYTDEATNERIKAMADKLLVAAEKYQLNRLKTICENMLIGTIGIANVLDMLKFADLHGANNLKKSAITFVNGVLKVNKK